ncbi:hypothetical protein NPIL_63541, partial [Nephila pilipes]
MATSAPLGGAKIGPHDPPGKKSGPDPTIIYRVRGSRLDSYAFSIPQHAENFPSPLTLRLCEVMLLTGYKYEPPLSSLRSRALTAEEERTLLPALQPEDLCFYFLWTGFKYHHQLPCKLILSSAVEEDGPL